MNLTFINIVVPNTVKTFNSLFLSKLSQPLLLKPHYPKNLIDFKHLSMIKAVNTMDKIKQSQYIYQDLQIPTTVSKKIVFAAVF
jgi:hypothetical protein